MTHDPSPLAVPSRAGPAPAPASTARTRRRSLLLALAGLAGGCATGAPARPGAASEPSSPVASSSVPARRPRLGLALGGGAARGFAHVGALAVLEQAGIRPDLVVGTSAGSLVGALWASGMDAAQLRQAALSLDEAVLGDWTAGGRSLLQGRALQDLVNRLVGNRPIERLPRRYAALATDLWNGRRVVFQRGDTGLAVRASSAVPGVFQPVRIDGREYVDGGLVSPIPVRACRELGAERVLAIDIAGKPQFAETETLPQIMLQTVTIMGQSIAAFELAEADLALKPQIGDLGSAAFEARRLSMDEGARAMREALPRLRALLGG